MGYGYGHSIFGPNSHHNGLLGFQKMVCTPATLLPLISCPPYSGWIRCQLAISRLPLRGGLRRRDAEAERHIRNPSVRIDRFEGGGTEKSKPLLFILPCAAAKGPSAVKRRSGGMAQIEKGRRTTRLMGRNGCPAGMSGKLNFGTERGGHGRRRRRRERPP